MKADRTASRPGHLESEKEAHELDLLAARCQQALLEGKPVSEAVSEKELERLRKRYSHFEDFREAGGYLSRCTHVVTRISTPKPYLHFIGSNHPREHGIYGSFWDPSGGGYSCLDSVEAGPVTSDKDKSYVPTAPRSTDYRCFFLREETGEGRAEIWHVLPQQGLDEKAYGNFRCEQGLGTVLIEADRNGIGAELLVFVPVEEPLEAWRLKLTNTGRRNRRLSLFLLVHWGLESYPGHYFDPRVVSQGLHFEELHSLIGLNHDKKNTHPRTGFLCSREPFAGFDMTGEEFKGGGPFRIFPRAVEEGRCRSSMGDQPYLGLIAALQFDLELAPGGERSLDFLLGVTSPEPDKAWAQLGSCRDKFFAPGGFEQELVRLEESWKTLIGRHQAHTPDEEIDRFFNIWSKYQARLSCRLPLSLDMVGYRDTLQYMMGISSFDPEYVAGHLPTVLSHQYEDGTAPRQFAKFAGAPHDLRKYMDNCSWIADTLVGYLQETGDFAFLERELPFFDPQTGRLIEEKKATVYEHGLRSLKGLFSHRAANGLCLIGHGDWNDSLDGVGKEDGAGVSVWLSMALVFAARRFRELALWRGDNGSVALLDGIIEEMTGTINRVAWDGGHYVYALMPDGTPVGSATNEEGKIHLNVNAWSLFNGVAEKAGRVDRVLAAIAGLDTPLGHLLLAPPYTQKSRYVGRIADIIPGQFENGSIYTHGQSFYIYGLTALGNGDTAYRELKKILPSSTIPDIATGAPHQLSNFTVGTAHPHFGRNLYNNFSGSINWLRKSLDRMLGVLADFDSLALDPVVPGEWKNFEVRKVFRGCRIHVRFQNPQGVNHGVVSAAVEGEKLPVSDGRAVLPGERLRGAKEAKIEVVLGR